jgi:hypothetical protein
MRKKPEGWTDEAWTAKVLRKSIMISDCNALRKEALSKKIADEKMVYEAAYFEE